MSSSLSGLSICRFPSSSSNPGRRFGSSLPVSWRVPAKPKRAVGVVNAGRDSLDHLQRGTQQQPKRRSVNSQTATPLVLWDRYPAARTVQQMMDTMERLMEDPVAYNGDWRSAPIRENDGYSRRGRTPWAIQERESVYKIRLDMPGMRRGDVRVWVEEKSMLVVKAEKRKEEGAAAEEEEWPAESYGKCNTRIALPEGVDLEKIGAEVKDGVLYIEIPKAKAEAKKIDVNVQ